MLTIVSPFDIYCFHGSSTVVELYFRQGNNIPYLCDLGTHEIVVEDCMNTAQNLHLQPFRENTHEFV